MIIAKVYFDGKRVAIYNLKKSLTDKQIKQHYLNNICIDPTSKKWLKDLTVKTKVITNPTTIKKNEEKIKSREQWYNDYIKPLLNEEKIKFLN
jgi:hypothetical protein